MLKPTGIPHFMNYVTHYKRVHDLSNFAGNLMLIRNEYPRSTEDRKKVLSEQFHAIIDNLVMKNGVKKTTYSMRQNGILSGVMGEDKCRIAKDRIRVLDVPSSSGTASLDMYEVLRRHYAIESYLFADLYLTIYYDSARGCVHDEDGNLLQVRLRNQFFSIYRPNTTGDLNSLLGFVLFLPFSLVSWYFRRKHPFAVNHCSAILLLHPDVEGRLSDDTFGVRRIDVFKRIDETFDLILSFNLLQKNYFPRHVIERGVDNLKEALSEGGLLIMGNTESFSVSRKSRGELLLLKKVGEF